MRLTREAVQVLHALARYPGSMRPVSEWLGVLPFDAGTFVQALAELGAAHPPLVTGRNEGDEDHEIHVVGITTEGVRRAHDDPDEGVL